MRVGVATATPDGNRFVPCQADMGVVAFWASARNTRNMDAVVTRAQPFQIKCRTIEPDRAKFPGHDFWVPESEDLQFLP